MAYLLTEVPDEQRTATVPVCGGAGDAGRHSARRRGHLRRADRPHPRGENGFGYDPWFIPDEQPAGQQLTFGQLPLDFKHTISHRGKALRNLAAKMGELGLQG